jgi:DNA-binding MarR family transcriptional regulator
VVRALEKRIRQELGLPLAGYEVLVRLAEVPEGERVRMQELARRVLLSKSGLSQLFTRLERRGLVERRGDPENLRVTYALITEKGKETLERALPAFREEIDERFAGHLNREEIRRGPVGGGSGSAATATRVGSAALRQGGSPLRTPERALAAAAGGMLLGASLLGARFPRLVAWPLAAAGGAIGGLSLLRAARRGSSG